MPERAVPRRSGQQAVGGRQPSLGRRGADQHRLAGRNHVRRIARDSHAVELAVVPDDIDDRGGDDGPAGREVLGRLRRADEARRLVRCERHHGHVPTGQIGGQIVVSLGSKVMDVESTRQARRIDLDHRPDHDEMPIRAGSRYLGQECKVDPLVDHAIEAEAGVGNGGLVGRILAAGSGADEMITIDARRTGVHIVVPAALGLEQAVPAGEHDVGPVHQLRFEPLEVSRCEPEGREFVHAIIDDGGSVDVTGEAVHHRRIEPQHRPAAALHGEQHVEHLAQRLLAGSFVPPMRHARTQRDHVLLRERMVFEIGAVMVAQDRFLEHEHPATRREAGHQVLRPLEHEVPPQMGETDQRTGCGELGLCR